MTKRPSHGSQTRNGKPQYVPHLSLLLVSVMNDPDHALPSGNRSKSQRQDGSSTKAERNSPVPDLTTEDGSEQGHRQGNTIDDALLGPGSLFENSMTLKPMASLFSHC